MIEKILKFDWQNYWLSTEANNFLPRAVIDAHTHCALPITNVPMINRLAQTPGASFNYFSLPLYQEIFKKMFPAVEYRQVCFGFPHLYGQEQLSNNYLLAQSAAIKNLVPIALCPAQTLLSHNYLENFFGLKMYRHQQQSKEGTKIVDIFPEIILQMINSIQGNIILHLPENILTNIEELMMLSKKYAKTNFVLAHMGVMYLNSPLYPNALKELSHRPNIFLDTAMVSDAEVFLEALKYLGHKKILFGSDAPFSLINGNFCLDENLKMRLKSDEDFAWVKKRYTLEEEPWPNHLFHYRIITALKQAITEFGGPTKLELIKNEIFFRNALRLFV